MPQQKSNLAARDYRCTSGEQQVAHAPCPKGKIMQDSIAVSFARKNSTVYIKQIVLQSNGGCGDSERI